MFETTIELTAPKSWKELNEKQLIYISWLFSQNDFTEEEILTYAFVRFCGLKVSSPQPFSTDKKKNFEEKKRWFKKKNFILSLDEQEVLWFSKQFKYLTSGIDEVIPLRKMSGKTHVDLRLRNVPLRQYLAIENYYQAFIFKKNPIFLDRLCACFYTNRKKFSDSNTEKFSRRFARLPFHMRYTVFLWYIGLKKVLKNHFPNYFIEMEVDPTETPTPPNMRKQIENMMRSLSSGDVTKVNDIYDVDTWSALAELDAKALEYKIMKSKIKK
jgi:hypothetical protein